MISSSVVTTENISVQQLERNDTENHIRNCLIVLCTDDLTPINLEIYDIIQEKKQLLVQTPANQKK